MLPTQSFLTKSLASASASCFSCYILVKALTLQRRRTDLSLYSETEPEVQHLQVSDVTPESFRLTWTAEDDTFDTFVVMASRANGSSQPQELVLGGEERSADITYLMEDTEYNIEIFGLISQRRSKSLMERVRTGIRPKDGASELNLEQPV